VINGRPPELPATHPNGSPNQSLHIDLEDDDEANLLQHLPSALDFISQALRTTAAATSCAEPQTSPPGKQGSAAAVVLIHCVQGVSRSASLAIAYLLHTNKSLDPDSALELLKKSHPSAAPNSNFMNQLHLFHCMNCTLDPSYVPYRRFLATQAAVNYHNTGTVDAAALNMPSIGDGKGQATLYRCRKCRKLLATSDNVLETEVGGQTAGFAWRKRDKYPKERLSSAGGGGDGNSSGYNIPGGDGVEGINQGGLFVEPLRWMSTILSEGHIQGKLYCPTPKCTARLGTFNWSGIQNSEGAWVTPGFHLHLTRLDAEDPTRQAALQAQLNGVHISTPISCCSNNTSTTPASIAGGIRQPRLLSSFKTNPPATTISTTPSTTTNSVTFPTKFTHLILDCDGVMVDSERPSCEALRRAILSVTNFDIPHEFPHDFRPVFGMDVYSCVEYYSKRFAAEHNWGNKLEFLAKKVSEVKEGIYKELTKEGVKAFSGVQKLVESARKLNMGVAIASSGSPEKIEHNLSTSGLGNVVKDKNLIVSAKYVKRGKPAPDVYLEALRRVGCDNARFAVVVEDAVNGLKAAKAAGCFTVAVTTSLPRESLVEHADVVVDKLEEIGFDAIFNAAFKLK
jgi:dual specificity phosphatase 12